MNSSGEDFHSVTEYHAPEWCAELLEKPTHRITLAMKPTPIHRWHVPDIPTDYEIFVKIDDMTGCDLGGNKVRCLEFLLAEAKVRGCSAVITTGSPHANHCRATAIAAKQIGLDCHIIMWDKDGNSETEVASGNSLLLQTAEPDIYLYPWGQFSSEIIEKNCSILENYVLKTTGKRPYVIPLGGANEIGIHGYLCAWDEMIQQGLFERFDDIVLAAGSGGTATSIAIANYLTGSKLRVHAVSVCYNAKEIHSGINATMGRVGMKGVKSEDIINVIDDYIGRGYGTYEEEDIGGIFGITEAKVSKLYQADSARKMKRWSDIFPDACQEANSDK